MSDEERSMLKAVSKARGCSMAAWVRGAVREAFEVLVAKTTPEVACICGHSRASHFDGNGHCKLAPNGCYCRDFKAC